MTAVFKHHIYYYYSHFSKNKTQPISIIKKKFLWSEDSAKWLWLVRLNHF